MNVIHDKNNNTFYIEIDGKRALTHYTVVDKKVIDFDHTFVPPEFRSKGIARLLFEEIVKYLEEHNIKVLVSCWYAERFFNDEKYRKYLAGI